MEKTAEKDNMLILPDCSALNEKGGCTLLNIKRCKGYSCRFVHSTEDEKRAALSWSRRLSSLSTEEQQKISKKYYNGSMPWKE